MAGVYKVPGVYIEEPFGLSMSIQAGETAVPVFAIHPSIIAILEQALKNHSEAVKAAKSIINLDGVTELDSWLSVTTIIDKALALATGHIETPEKKDEKVKQLYKIVSDSPLYQSLRLYFLNGGGHCYMASASKLAELVPGLDDVTLLVQAGSDLASFKPAVDALCVKGNTYFAIYDSENEELKDTAAVKTAADRFENPNEYAAVYYPWLNVGTEENKVPVPPSGAVAGVYARVDRERGVWKAPANVEIVGATPLYRVSDTVDAECNVPAGNGPLAINVIRTFRGTGPLVWGARTLKADSDNWRYVPVRRLFNAAERDIKTAMSVALFEPNSAPTWERVRSAVENYVHSLWQQGALLGATPEEAYFVHIGKGITMTDDDVQHGRMIVKVGMAAVRPAEFIILQLTQDVVPA